MSRSAENKRPSGLFALTCTKHSESSIYAVTARCAATPPITGLRTAETESSYGTVFSIAPYPTIQTSNSMRSYGVSLRMMSALWCVGEAADAPRQRQEHACEREPKQGEQCFHRTPFRMPINKHSSPGTAGAGAAGASRYCGLQTEPTAQLRNGFAAPRTSKWRCGPVASPVAPT